MILRRNTCKNERKQIYEISEYKKSAKTVLLCEKHNEGITIPQREIYRLPGRAGFN